MKKKGIYIINEKKEKNKKYLVVTKNQQQQVKTQTQYDVSLLWAHVAHVYYMFIIHATYCMLHKYWNVDENEKKHTQPSRQETEV